jgi:hypothetical protein
MSARRGGRWIVGLLAAAMVAGCGDDGPSGPGTLDVRVTSASSSLGAVILQVQGSGITAVSGTGSNRVVAGSVQQDARSVIVVGPGPGELRFALEVQDVGSTPTVTVVAATDASNLEITAIAGIDVRVSAR